MSTLPDNDNGRDEPMVFIVIGKAYETDNSEGIDIHVILRRRMTTQPFAKR
ncbi:hypothetical protein C241_03866 [Bradyrhizobium lupini HPC(L)]|uniref:Uncharacterized protein n=1 Tax=Bradyrhizobium lupini HPC(L) TaxID=1229491 RepID=A0ABN0HQR2_RHILU|nr:hypothetical protein C241_03866 [Bradyrhizobium lupini HPC(L)]